MYCSKCGVENPENAQTCRSCGTQLSPPPVSSQDVMPKRSSLAITAFILGIVSFVFFPVGLIAIILGIASIIAIEKSGGRFTGKVFAVLGILIPVFVFCLIFVLMAALYPALVRAKKQARAVVCMTNLKQWGIVFCLYTQDNNGYFFTHKTDQTGCWWMDPLEAYCRDNKELLFCPEAAKPYEEGGDPSFAAWNVGDESGSYGLNGWSCNPAQEETTFPPGASAEYYWKTSNIKGASNIPVFLDAAGIAGWPRHTDNPVDNPGESRERYKLSGGGMDCFCINRHTGYSGVLFMDWSVRKAGLKELWTLKWHRQFDTEGRWTRAGHVMPSDWPPWMRNFRDY
jgi:hypothetical protein